MNTHRRRARVEAGLAALTGLLCLLTAVLPDWIEAIFKIDPDGGNGSAEWLIVLGLAVITAILAFASRRNYRQLAFSAETE